VAGYLTEGGFTVNNSLILEFDLLSPLIYYQFTTNSSGQVVVTTWSGEQQIYTPLTNNSLVSGFFNYTDRGTWFTEEEEEGIIYRLSNVQDTTETNDFSLCPAPWNYTGGGEIPSNYSVMRVTKTETGTVFVLNSQEDYLELGPYSSAQAYLLVRAPSVEGLQLWYHPLAVDGQPVTEELCLANPGACSFIRTSTAIRSLDFSWYLCVSGLGQPIVQAVECSVGLASLILQLDGWLYSWRTCVKVTSTAEISILNSTYDLLEYQFIGRTSYPFSIQFLGVDSNLSSVLDPVFLTLERVTFPCACPGSLLEANQSVLNFEWYNQAGLREPRLDLTGPGDWVVFALYPGGVREFKRGIIVETNAVSTVFKIYDPWFYQDYFVYSKDVRSISPAEALRGWSDGDLFVTPFRCPDGRLTTAGVTAQQALANANCTVTGGLDLPTLVSCNFTDPTQARYGCTCNLAQQVCQCGLPATPNFELDLLRRMNLLTSTGCQGIIFTPDILDVANYSTTVTGINSKSFSSTYRETQQVTQLVVKTTTCTYPAQFEVWAGSFLFSNLTLPVQIDLVTNLTTCEFWITLEMLPAPAWTNLTVYSNTTISWVTTRFATFGFSLTNLLPGPTYTASSNPSLAPNVNLGSNASYWVSSNSRHEIPVFIQVEFAFPQVVDHMVIDFYMVGKNNMSNTIYVQGFTNNSWFGLGAMSLFVEEGGWSTVSFGLTPNASYSMFRLITQAGRFGVRHWGIYSNQQFVCEDGSSMIFRADSLTGLKSIQVLLDEIAFFEENVDELACFGVNNCTIRVGSNTDALIQVANDGVCQDVYYMGSIAGLPRRVALINSESLFIQATYEVTTEDLLPGINVVQFTNLSSQIQSEAQLLTYYDAYLDGSPTPANATFMFENVTVYFYYSSNNSVIQFNQSALSALFYINETTELLFLYYAYEWGNLLTDGLSCQAGFDLADCGPYIRNVPLMPGVGCSLTYAQANLANLISNTTTLVNKTYFTSNFSELESWSASFYNLQINRTYLPITLLNCAGGQVCEEGINSFMCLDGSCVQFPEDCDNRYTCPGNGCVQQTDASVLGNLVFRCACAPGYSGDGCPFGPCQPATPELEVGVPGAEECTCGGPDPLREKPPIVNIGLRRVTTKTLIELNNRVTSNSAPKSAQDIAYLRVMPQAGPWGRVLRVPRLVITSDILSDADQTVWSTCPYMRRGYYNQQIYLEDDVQARDPVTGAITWRVYINPTSGLEETFTWSSPFQYDDFPYRCPNGQCVAEKSDCAASEALYPLCNGRGTCMSDGTCECFTGWKTFMITETYSQYIRYPYAVINGVPDPTVWERNYNSIHHGLNQCNARDCDAVDCTAPTGCFPGTPELDFEDKLELCLSGTGSLGLCAPSQKDCTDKVNLTPPIRCSGRGVVRVKDFTGEEYCQCGDISNSLLTPNGWSGPNCDQYFASSGPIYWSFWDYEINEPYRSKITNEVLPGKWVSRNRIIGPDPDDRIVWEQCCPDIDRFEKCAFVPCRQLGKLVCTLAQDCKAPSVPLVYPCNNHGVARADGTCECDISVEDGTGYTYDYSQFSDKGCYRFLQCPDCHFVPACTEPAEWRHPLPFDIGLDQQWYSCIGGLGLYSNETILNELSSSVNQRKELLVQGLSQIGVRTQRAVNDLSACICVYPNDTQFIKEGMLPGSVFKYKQNYRTPYPLSGVFTGYPFLEDTTLEALPFQAYNFSAGDVIRFKLNNNQSTTISSVRVWGINFLNTTTITVTSGGQEVCPEILLTSPINTRFQEWVATDRFTQLGGNAHQCGPRYSCFDFRKNDPIEFAANCAIPDSTECQDWQNSVCVESALRVLWPIESSNNLVGCRSSNPECTCCTRLTEANPPATSGEVVFTMTAGSATIGQMRVYGYTEEALTVPSGLLSTLQRSLGTQTDAATCQDRKFFTEYLPEDGNPYSPPQNLTTSADAFNVCNATGGWLATSLQLTGDQNDIAILQAQCAGISTASNEKCWVAGRDTLYITEFIERSDLINDNCMFCYIPSRTFPEGLFRPISFSVYPDPITTQFQSGPVYTDQISTRLALAAVGLTERETGFSYIDYNDIYTPRTSSSCQVDFIYSSNSIFGTSETVPYLFPAGDMQRWANLYTPQFIPIKVFTEGPRQWSYIEMTPPNCAIIRFYSAQAGAYIISSGDIVNTRPLYTLKNVEAPVGYTPQRFARCGALDAFAKDFIGGEYGLLCNSQVYAAYMSFIPAEHPTYYRIRVSPRKTRYTTYGSYGRDFLPGVDIYQYLPAFIDIRYTAIFTQIWYEGIANRAPILTDDTPVYLKSVLSPETDLSNWYTPVTIENCLTCIKVLEPRYEWDQFSYSTGAWQGNFNPGIKDNIQLRFDNGLFRNLLDSGIPFITHQVTYIESRNNTLLSPSRRDNTNAIQWFINNCLVVGASGFEAVVCQENLYNFVCLYDYTRYTVVPGYQCDFCGDGSRSGGTPFPGNTCFSQFQLANATANPISHAILNSYQQGTLGIYADSFNMPTDIIDFMNKSTIWGFEKAYLFWAADRSNRPGQATPAGIEEVLNWCDMSLTGIWPVDCGIQTNPTSNIRVRYCATNVEFCPPNTEIAPNAPIRASDVPPVFKNSDPLIASSDPTCGSTVRLQSYAKIDKYGGIEDDLDLYVVFLSLTPEYVQFQFNASALGLWYNSGKTTTKWVFEGGGTTSTVSGRYLLQGCTSCTNAIMELFIHPLNLLGTFPAPIIAVNVSLTNGVLTTYTVNFTVTDLDTGTTVIGGQTFPVITFQGLGYRFYNLPTTASITLYNPILTNPTTRAACLSKPNITYYEPRTRIESTAPLRQCILRESDLVYYPGTTLGTCACDLSTAGRECNCPAVTSKFGPAVCGGFGDSNTGVEIPGGQILTTGSGQEAGCYQVAGRPECKTVELGRAAYTLQVDLAPWDYPSVFINTPPQAGDGLFVNPVNTLNLQLTYEEVLDECTLEASFVPYYLTADELNQMLRKNIQLEPFFIAVTNTTLSYSLPWEDAIDNTFFINNGSGVTTVLAATDSNVDCTSVAQADACFALNINNLVYNASRPVTNGNIVITSSFSGALEWGSTSALEVLVYVFLPSLTTDFITCSPASSGTCSTRVAAGVNSYFNCRCPTRGILVSAGTYAEIQVFEQGGLLRSTNYKYN
jgi:hypothetical protein